MAAHHRIILPVLLSLACSAALFGAGSPPAHAHDYIVNGNFEAGTAGWTLLSPGSALDAEPDGVTPVAGAARARVTLGNPLFQLGQSLADVPAGDYRLSLWLRQSAPLVGGLYVEVGPNPATCGTNCRAEPPNNGGIWQRIELDLTLVTGGMVTLRIGGAGSTGDVIYVDDVRFEGAPPATMTSTPTSIVPPSSTSLPASATRTPGASATASPQPTSTPVLQTASLPGGTLQNGGFESAEDGVPVAWSKYGGTLASATDRARTGAASARLESTTESTKWLYQAVAVTGGASYEFDAWLLHADPGVSSAFLRVSWYAADDATGEALVSDDSTARLDAASPDWRYLTTGSITAPPAARSARLRIVLQPAGPAPAVLHADDATFMPAAPPPVAVAPGDDGAEVSAPVAGEARVDRANGAPPLAAASRASTGAKLLITEVLYDAMGPGDAEGEWVELYNPGPDTVSLVGWILADGQRPQLLPDASIEPHHYVVIAASDSLRLGSTVDVHAIGRIGNGLRNEGDVLVLMNPAGRFVDAVSWGDSFAAFNPPAAVVPAGHSIERASLADTDRGSDFVDNERPTPGGPYVGPREGALGEVAIADGQRPDVLASETPAIPASIAWLALAAASGAVAAAACWRAAPIIVHRLRHQ